MGEALWYLGCSFLLFPLGFFFQRRASGLLKPTDMFFELPCLGLDHNPAGEDRCLQVHCVYGIPKVKRGEEPDSPGAGT